MNPLLRDFCTALGALVLLANVALMVWIGVRGMAMLVGDWLADRRDSSGPACSSGEVRVVPDSNHPSLVPGEGGDGTARVHLRAVPSRRCSEGGAA